MTVYPVLMSGPSTSGSLVCRAPRTSAARTLSDGQSLEYHCQFFSSDSTVHPISRPIAVRPLTLVSVAVFQILCVKFRESSYYPDSKLSTVRMTRK